MRATKVKNAAHNFFTMFVNGIVYGVYILLIHPRVVFFYFNFLTILFSGVNTYSFIYKEKEVTREITF